MLFEKDIKTQEITVEWENEIPYFFNKDVFASTFFMVSRYEEYLPSELDVHQRYKAESSAAFKHNFLEFPVVNWWALALKKTLLKQQAAFTFPTTSYQFMNSLDIDIAYSYKGKSWLRLMSSTAKAMLTMDTEDLKNRFNYFIKKQPDPYDVYEKINTLKDKNKATTIYFFLLGNYATYDKNLSHNSKPYQKLIRQTSNDNAVGIHPSYLSNNKSQLKTEIFF